MNDVDQLSAIVNARKEKMMADVSAAGSLATSYAVPKLTGGNICTSFTTSSTKTIPTFAIHPSVVRHQPDSRTVPPIIHPRQVHSTSRFHNVQRAAI